MLSGALPIAPQRRQMTAGIVHPSDRGSQGTTACQFWLVALAVATPEAERVNAYLRPTLAAAVALIFAWIAVC